MKSKIYPTVMGLLLLVLASFLASCGDTGTTGEVKNNHEINLVHSYDGASGQIISYLQIIRDGEPLDGMVISVFNATDTAAIATLDRVAPGNYGKWFSGDLLDNTRQLKIELSSVLDVFNFNFLCNMPDTFSFTAPGLPDNIVRSSDATIPLSWNSSTHADGYFVVVEAENTASGVAGYSEFFSSGVTAGSIPISAFHNAQGFKEGTYYVWVVAYHDNPIEYPGISFSLPAGFQNNISRVGVTGQGGAMYIPPKLVLTAQTN